MSQSGVYEESGSGGSVSLIADNSVVVPPNPATGDITVAGGTGISTFGDAGTYTLTINYTGAGFVWQNTTSSVTMASFNGYYCSGGGDLFLALPTSSSFGDEISIVLDGATSFSISQASGQQIRLGNSQTTLGTSGSLVSTEQGDEITLVCKVANTLWTATNVIGNLTVN